MAINPVKIGSAVLIAAIVACLVGHEFVLGYVKNSYHKMLFFDALQKEEAAGNSVVKLNKLVEEPWDTMCLLSLYDGTPKYIPLDDTTALDTVPLDSNGKYTMVFIRKKKIILAIASSSKHPITEPNQLCLDKDTKITILSDHKLNFSSP